MSSRPHKDNRPYYPNQNLRLALAHLVARGEPVAAHTLTMLEEWAAGDDSHKAACEAWFARLNPHRRR
jgi:hypothetical protein